MARSGLLPSVLVLLAVSSAFLCAQGRSVVDNRIAQYNAMVQKLSRQTGPNGYSTLITALLTTDAANPPVLNDVLNSTVQTGQVITILAPTNAAFAAVPTCSPALDLTAVLLDHVLPRRLNTLNIFLAKVPKPPTVAGQWKTLGSDNLIKTSAQAIPGRVGFATLASGATTATVAVSARAKWLLVYSSNLINVIGIDKVLAYCP